MKGIHGTERCRQDNDLIFLCGNMEAVDLNREAWINRDCHGSNNSWGMRKRRMSVKTILSRSLESRLGFYARKVEPLKLEIPGMKKIINRAKSWEMSSRGQVCGSSLDERTNPWK